MIQLTPNNCENIPLGSYVLSLDNFNTKYVLDATDDIRAKKEMMHLIESFLITGQKVNMVLQRYERTNWRPIIAQVTVEGMYGQ